MPSVSILAEPPVSVVDKVVDKRGTRSIAQAYLEYLYTPQAQEAIAKNFYRPRNQAIAAKHPDNFAKMQLFTIDEVFGGWESATKAFFADGAFAELDPPDDPHAVSLRDRRLPRAGDGEPIGQIGGDARAEYSGYVDKAASEKKVLHDVFERGDGWFATGDLMKSDADGYFYFVDRIGDTFRWKGENVATMEVGIARPGMMVARKLRRKMKMMITTSPAARSSVSSASRMDRDTKTDWSNATLSCTPGGSDF